MGGDSWGSLGQVTLIAGFYCMSDPLQSSAKRCKSLLHRRTELQHVEKLLFNCIRTLMAQLSPRRIG